MGRALVAKEATEWSTNFLVNDLFLPQNEIVHTSTRERVFKLGDNVGLTPLAARTSSGVLHE